MKLKEKLLAIQKELQYFKKDTQGFNYQYVSGTDILSKVRPLMDMYELLLVQEIFSSEVIPVEYSTKNGMVKGNITNAHFVFTWIDCKSDEKLQCNFYGQGNDNADKGIGMACTYAERYFLLKFFHVPTDTDDPDYHEPLIPYEKLKALKENASIKKLSDQQQKFINKSSQMSVDVYTKIQAAIADIEIGG